MDIPSCITAATEAVIKDTLLYNINLLRIMAIPIETRNKRGSMKEVIEADSCINGYNSDNHNKHFLDVMACRSFQQRFMSNSTFPRKFL